MPTTGSIDEHGMITNMLPVGLQLDTATAIKEFIDNSIDACATRVDIKLVQHENYICVTIVDNGTGMNVKGRESFITLCEKNKNPSKNGFYGVGSIASLATLSKKTSNFTENRVNTILTVSDIDDKKTGYGQIIIDWEIIESNQDPKVWSNNVKAENMSFHNYNIWTKQNLSTGTYIEFNSSVELFSNELIKRMDYEIQRSYAKLFRESKLKVFIEATLENESKYKSLINKDRYIDFINYDEIKENAINIDFKLIGASKDTTKNLELYCEYNISMDSNNNFKAELVETNIVDLEKEYKDNDFKDPVVTFSHKVVWKSKENFDQDTDITKEYINSSRSSWTAGQYFIRNDKILGNPIALYKIRTDQSHTRWRALTDLTDSRVMQLVEIGINKSEIKKDNVNKKFYTFISQVTNGLVGRAVGFTSKTYKCKVCNNIKSQCTCCNTCKKSPCVCLRCSRCSEKECICCKKCQKKRCICCSKCDRPPRSCECCKICDNLKEDCNCCAICNLKKEDCKCFDICCGCNKINKVCTCCKKCGPICERCENPSCNKKKCEYSCNCVLINGDWKNNNGEVQFKNGEKEKYGYVYMIQPNETWNTSVVKIGRTENQVNKTNYIKRFREYSDYTKIICIYEVADCVDLEDKLKKRFKNDFQIYDRKKPEWFTGDIVKMKKTFLDVVINHDN